MSQTPSAAPGGIIELKASAYQMTLDTGLFCIFQPGGGAARQGGLPGIRISRAPGALGDDRVAITAFRDDGWLGDRDDAALVRVQGGPAQILVTIYQAVDGTDAPKLQVQRLGEMQGQPAEAAPAPATRIAGPPASPPEIGAHVQMRGDVAAPLESWVGDRGSQRWVEGFAIAPASVISVEDIEYQALLGRGWLSPWAEGGQFCGSRGMALPILGLRVRLRNEAAHRFECVYEATFVDGTTIGPVSNGQPCEAPSLAPLEAFTLALRPLAGVEPAAKAKRSKAGAKA